MFYILIPQTEYTYEPHIISKSLVEALSQINDGRKTNNLTLLVRTVNSRDLLWFYKDIRYRDRFADRNRLEYLSSFSDSILKASGIKHINSVKVEEYEDHPDKLLYNMQYDVFFADDYRVRLNTLVLEDDLNFFFEKGIHYASQHKTIPLVFHDLRKINYRKKNNFFDVLESCKHNGLQHYFFPTQIKKLDHPTISYNRIDSYLDDQYGLYELSNALKDTKSQLRFDY
ncbi:MAG: hypothetical protein WD059_04085 [Balneolaceae bacterium]